MTFADPTCPSRKKVYLTWTHAQHDAEHLRRNGKRADARPYHCTTCHKFHTGGSLT